MKIFAKTLILLMAVGLMACGDAKYPMAFTEPSMGGADESFADPSKDMEQAPPVKSADPVPMDRKLIKTGDVSFETGDIAADRARVNQVVKALGGYVGGESENFYGARHEVRYTLRVPSDKFDELVEKVTEGAKHIDSKNIRVSDVTMEYHDVQARIKTKKEIRDRYSELLSRAKTVSEVLDVERELGTIQVEIESLEGRMKVMENQVSLGTLELVIWEGQEVPQGWGGRFGDAAEGGWNGFVWFLVVIVGLWPFWLLSAGVFFLIRYLVRRGRRNS